MSAANTAPLRLGAFLLLCGGAMCAQNEELTSLSLEDLMKIEVQTVSLHPQSLARAPGAVTVITAEQIRKFGYRTFGEALNHVRGFYQTYDRTYNAVGISGFSVPGDWATRTLVLLNGHAMTENIFGSANYFGEDFALDMSLVDRIEVVRGPSSALYGSNGLLATINVITKSPSREQGTSVRTETDSLGMRKATLTQTVRLGGNNSLLVSGTVFNSSGQHDIYLPEYDTPATGNGHAIGMDGRRGYKFFANLKAGNWEFLSLASSREKIQPVSWGDTLFNDRGTRATDQRAFVDAQYSRELASGHSLRWRTFYDRYRFHGVYYYPLEDNQINLNREYDAGDWVGSRLTDRFAWMGGYLTAGAELKFDLRALQSAADYQPVFLQTLNVNKRDSFAAGFLQQEYELGRYWSLNVGLRYDWSRYRSSSISPRAALVFQPNKSTSLKLLYGRGFRNPNANELFFDDGNQNAGNLNLRPERANTFELVLERNFHRNWRASLSAYHLDDKGIIVPGYTDAGLIQFQNADRFRGQGVGLELSGTLFSQLELTANFQKQHAMLGNATPPNSPGEVGKLQLSKSLLASRMTLSGGLLYISERRTLAQLALPPVYLPEATLTARLAANLDLQLGVRNFNNSRYLDPVGMTPTVDTVRQPGRTFFVAFSPRFRN